MKTYTTNPIAAALCVGFLASAITPVAVATENPFAATVLEGGYQLAAADKTEEGKCGEGKCGGEKKAGHEGKSDEGKPGGEEKAGHEGKCGEGKCGGDKPTT